MCGSPYDYCMPAYLNRTDDYRGCDPLYRSGSIFSQSDCYRGYGDDDTLVEDRSLNAGNFGVTKPIDSTKPTLGPRRGSAIAKPPTEPVLNGNGFDTPTQGVEELLRDGIPGTPTPLSPTPLENNVVPPVQQPRTPTSPVETPVQPMPFSMPNTDEPAITLEDLKRLDPTVTDFKIINIDDTLDTTPPMANSNR